MAVKLVKLGRSASLYGLSMLIGRLSSVFLLPIYTRVLTPADYGVLEVIDLSVQVITMILGMGLAGDALFYFYSKSDCSTSRSRVFCTILATSVVAGVIGALLAATFSSSISTLLFRSAQYELLVRVGVAVIAFSLPFEVLLAFLRLDNQVGMFTSITLAKLALAMLLNLVFLFVWKLGAMSMLLSGVLSVIPFTLFLMFRIFRDRTQWNLPSKNILRQVFVYSLPLGVTSILLMAINFGDRFFLVRYVSISDLGIYGLAYKCGMLVGYVSVSFQMFWRANMHKILGGAGGDEVFVRLLTWLTLIYGLITIAAVIFSRIAFSLIAGPAFLSAEIYLPFIALAYSIRAIEFQLQSVFLTTAKTREVLRTTLVGAIVSIGGYMILVPILKVWGAVIATLAAFLSMLVVTAVRSSHIKKYRFEYAKIAWIVGCVALVIAMRITLQPLLGYPVTAIACLLIAALTLLGAPNLRDERRLFMDLFAQYLGRRPRVVEAPSS